MGSRLARTHILQPSDCNELKDGIWEDTMQLLVTIEAAAREGL